ncbi:hypothetical protein ACLB2K_054515 [Fragaria x ananassa]
MLYGYDDTELPFFDLRCVLAATNNFSEANKLGEGGFGPVYKGIFPENQEVAIKRLSKKSGQGHEEFLNEIKLIAKLQHNNLSNEANTLPPSKEPAFSTHSKDFGSPSSQISTNLSNNALTVSIPTGR